MKRLLLILSIALAIGVSFANAQQSTVSSCYTTNGINCVPGIQTSLSVPISVSSSGTLELVSAVANKAIYITSFDIMAAGTVNAKLVYGTGTNCGTGTTNLTGNYPFIAQAGVAKGTGTGYILYVPLGNALCTTIDASILVAGSLSYVQF